jgi:hypothetical protein
MLSTHGILSAKNSNPYITPDVIRTAGCDKVSSELKVEVKFSQPNRMASPDTKTTA